VYDFGGIRSRNLRVYDVNNSTFCGDTAKIGISRQISQNVLYYRFGRRRLLVGMIIPIFFWRLPKGRCYDNQLNLGDVREHRQERPLLFALALDNGLADRKSAFTE